MKTYVFEFPYFDDAAEEVQVFAQSPEEAAILIRDQAQTGRINLPVKFQKASIETLVSCMTEEDDLDQPRVIYATEVTFKGGQL